MLNQKFVSSRLLDLFSKKVLCFLSRSRDDRSWRFKDGIVLEAWRRHLEEVKEEAKGKAWEGKVQEETRFLNQTSLTGI